VILWNMGKEVRKRAKDTYAQRHEYRWERATRGALIWMQKLPTLVLRIIYEYCVEKDIHWAIEGTQWKRKVGRDFSFDTMTNSFGIGIRSLHINVCQLISD
jgi:hypothetical protein